MRWGFLPGFVKDPETFPLLINARAETLLGKAQLSRRRETPPLPRHGRRLLRMAPRGRRRGDGPSWSACADRQPMGFAGLYETWSDPNGGEIDTAYIITSRQRLIATSTTACRRSSEPAFPASGSTMTASKPPRPPRCCAPPPTTRWSLSPIS